MNPSKNALLVGQPAQAAQLLQAAGYQTMLVDNNLEAIRKVIRYKPDLILASLDQSLFSGLDMLKFLGLFQFQFPCILTTTEAVPPKVSFNQSLVGVLPLSALRSRLPALLQEIAQQAQEQPIGYHYQLRQREWMALASLSGAPRILVVEDSDWIRRANLMLLDSVRQYHLFSAQDGLEGILKALLLQPDLILADIHMPVIDGIEMSQIFYIFDQPFPLVFLTADDDPQLQAKAQSIDGVIGYMNKKTLRDKDKFLQEISKHLAMAHSLKASLGEIYEKGNLEQLLQKTGDKGIFMPGCGLTRVGADYKPPGDLIVPMKGGRADGLSRFVRS